MAVAVCAGFVQRTEISSWSIAREEADEQTLINIASQSDHINAGDGWKDVPVRGDNTTGANRILLTASAGSSSAKTFSFRILVRADDYAPAEVAAVGTGETGTQQVNVYPYNKASASGKYWVELFSVTSYWWKPVATKDNGGNNYIDGIILDLVGCKQFKVEVYNADGTTGSEAGDVAFYWRYY